METTDSRAFGDLLRHYRDAAGLTQEALAERAGLSAEAISLLERGERRRPHAYTVGKLAAALALREPDRAQLAAAAQRQEARAPAPARGPRPAPAPWVSPSPRLVGRGSEMGLLERHLAGEGPPVLMLAGEPGIGKTRLAQEAAQRAAARGWHVLWGGCQRRGGQDPYAPILEAVDHYLGQQPPIHLRRDLRGCAWLVRLLPELAAAPLEPLPIGTVPPEQERRLMFAAVGRFLRNVADPGGVLLVLDDLQWAGADALDLLATLVRSARDVPLRLIGAYRDTEVQPRDALGVLLGDLAQAGLVTHRSLPPLALSEAAQLLDDLLAPVEDDRGALCAQVVARAEGVPFFLVSYVQAVRDPAGDGLACGQPAVPWTLAQGIRQRVAALPEGAQEVLGMAAVVSRRVAGDLLVRLAPWPEPEVLRALQSACRARLLEEDGAQGYVFTHDVIREVVDADLGAARRATVHRQVAAALEREGGRPAVELLAYHYARGGVAEKAAVYLEQAGDRAGRQAAHDAATGYYRDAVGWLERLERRRDAARVREKLGTALHRSGRHEATLEVLEQAAETYRTVGDGEGFARSMAQVGRVYRTRGTATAGIARLQPLLEPLAARGPSASLAALSTELCGLYMVTGRFDEALPAAVRAVKSAGAVGDEPGLIAAGLAQSRALYHLGQGDESVRVAEETRRRAEAVGDVASLSAALDALATIASQRGDLAGTKAFSRQSLALTERLGYPVVAASLMLSRVFYAAFFLGEWAECHHLLERAAALLQQADTSSVTCVLLLQRGRLGLAEGAWEDGMRDLTACLALCEPSSGTTVMCEVQYLLAEHDVQAGRPAAARDRLVPFLAGPGCEAPDVTELLPTLAEAYLELGAVEQAAAVVAQALDRARARNEWLYVVPALRVQALVAGRQGHGDEAEQALEEGLALARRMPYPQAEARLREAYALLHLQKGESAPARAQLEAAVAIFHGLGASKEAERLEQIAKQRLGAS